MQCKLIHDGLKIIIYIKRKSKYTHTHTHTHVQSNIVMKYSFKNKFIKKGKTSIKKIELICIISPKWCKKFNKEIKGIDNNNGFEKM